MMKRIINLSVLISVVLAFLFIGPICVNAGYNADKIGDNGIGDDGISGDRANSYAWSMDVLPMDFENDEDDGDYLYIGVNRGLVNGVLKNMGLSNDDIETIFQGDIATPDPSPANRDSRGRIFRYKTDGSKGWELVFTSEIFMTTDQGFQIPRHFGYRAMKPFTDSADETALYVASSSFVSFIPTEVIKIPDNFDPSEDTPEVVLRVANAGGQNSIRAIEVLNGYLCIGFMNGEIYITDFPQAQPAGNGTSTIGWTKVAEFTDFTTASQANGGDPIPPPSEENDTTYPNAQFVSFNDYLYTTVARFNTVEVPGGFWIFKGKPVDTNDPKGEWEWSEVMRDGAGDPWNEAAGIWAFDDYVYVGTMIQFPEHLMREDGISLLYDNIDKLRCEVFRVDATDTWEMIIGTPEGNSMFDTRLGNYDSGFWDPILPFSPFDDVNASLNLYSWWMGVYNGKLFCSTFDVRVFLKYVSGLLEFFEYSQDDIEEIEGYIDLLDLVNDNPAGGDLYVTEDGINFSPVTLDGFGDEYNYGLRTLVGTPDVLFAGTANPFYGFQVWEVTETPDGGDDGSSCFISAAGN
ncbi:MAG: hypothetical protein J7K35_01365 [Syntrophobacterales bacterium]|nr:hypothetical protein [Syntrophobacterales bacterium]